MRTLSEATSSMTIFIFMRLFKKVLKLKNRQHNSFHSYILVLQFHLLIISKWILRCGYELHNHINVKTLKWGNFHQKYISIDTTKCSRC